MKDKGFGEFLVREELIRKETLRQARQVQGALGSRLDTALLDMGLVREPALLTALGRFHSTRTVSGIELAAVTPEVARVIPARVATRFGVVPFRLDGKKLWVAGLTPGDLMVEDEISMLTGCMVSGFAALEVRIYEALSRLYGFHRSVQITSLTKRLNGEARDASGAVPAVSRSEPGPAPPPASRAPARESAPTVAAVLRRRPTVDVTELEISDEDLELFPSLRDGADDLAPADRPEPLTETIPEPLETPAPLEEPGPPTAAVAAAAAADTPGDPEEHLARVSSALVNAEMREEIADAVLAFCAPYLKRRMMLSVRDDSVLGWRGEGEDVEPEIVRAITIPLSEPSVFANLIKGQEFWLAPLPPMPRNTELVFGLGGREPRECVILPIRIRSKIMCFLYGDNADEAVRGVPVDELKRLAVKAGLAFQVYLLKSKIRMV